VSSALVDPQYAPGKNQYVGRPVPVSGGLKSVPHREGNISEALTPKRDFQKPAQARTQWEGAGRQFIYGANIMQQSIGITPAADDARPQGLKMVRVRDQALGPQTSAADELVRNVNQGAAVNGGRAASMGTLNAERGMRHFPTLPSAGPNVDMNLNPSAPTHDLCRGPVRVVGGNLTGALGMRHFPDRVSSQVGTALRDPSSEQWPQHVSRAPSMWTIDGNSALEPRRR